MMVTTEKSTRVVGDSAEQRPAIYVVEDCPATRESLVSMLASRGYRCKAFESAESFLAAGASNRPGCLVLDYQLPGISGLELQDQLTSRGDSLPIIVTTGHADVPAAVRFMERCAVTLLEKPYQPEQLIEAIERAVAIDNVQIRVRSRFEEIGAAVDQLSSREKTVLQAIVAGQLNKSIARALDVSVRTIEGDRAKIVEKFKAETTGEVVGKYAQYSLLSELGYSNSRPPRYCG